jgi:hypothetical protein
MVSTTELSAGRTATLRWVVSLCRSTLVVPSRTTQASAAGTSAGSPAPVPLIRTWIPAASTPRANRLDIGYGGGVYIKSYTHVRVMESS